ncbi:MAG: MlaD family protein [Gemmatimonadota bacterium]|nr:MlaD family protein [Gemmatimonadota bacterium]
MPRAENWHQLKIGIVVFIGIVASVAAVMLFARVGALHGDTTRLYMVTDMAAGVLNGTEVRLAGQKVGLVRSVALRPPASDTSERVLIAMDILNPYLKYIRRNSDVQIAPGGQLIGSPVIYITPGTLKAEALDDGDTLRARAQMEARSGIADASSLGDSVTGIVATARTIRSQFDTTLQDVSSLASLSRKQAEAVRGALGNLSNRARSSRGTLAEIMRDTSRLRAESARLSSLADSIHAASSGGGEIGRFRRDSTLIRQAHATMGSVSALKAQVARYTGSTVGGTEMAAQLARAHAELDSVVQDAKHHPFRYLPF